MEPWSWLLLRPLSFAVLRFSALHHAALGGSLELISLLLEAQATVDIKDSNGKQLAHLKLGLHPPSLLLPLTSRRGQCLCQPTTSPSLQVTEENPSACVRWRCPLPAPILREQCTCDPSHGAKRLQQALL